MRSLNAKHWTIILLCLLSLFSGYHYGYLDTLPQVVLAVACTVLSNTIIDYFPTKKFKISESAIITGLIIGMVSAPRTSLPVIALLATIAIGSKYVIQINKRPVFNPAALSLLIGLFLFNVPLGWWGDHFSFLTIIAGSILLIKLSGHWKMIYTFLFSLTIFVILRSIFLQLPIIEQLYSNIGIAFFFTFFMLTDPKTSPLLPNQLWKFSLIAAFGVILSIQFLPSTIMIGGLLLANLLTPYINYIALKKIQAAALANASAAKPPLTTPPSPPQQ